MSTHAVAKKQARASLKAAGSSSSLPSRLPGVLIALVVLAAASAVLLAALQLVDLSVFGIGGFDELLRREPTWLWRLGIGAGAGAIGLIAAGSILRKPQGTRSSTSKHVVSMTERGVVFVSSEGLCSLAGAAAVRQRGVLDAEAWVRGNSVGPVEVHVRAAVLPGTSVKDTGDAAREAVAESIERLAGVEVARTTVEIVIAAPAEFNRILE